MAVSVTLKLATSLDGRIATASGESRWITGPEAREEVHRQRAAHDAVLVGIATVLADDPELTARIDPPLKRQPWRVVLDRRSRLPAHSRLAQSTDFGAVVSLSTGGWPQTCALDATRVERLLAPPLPGESEPHAALRIMEQALGIRTVYLEGGGQVAASFLRAGLVDRIEWFRAPMLLGQEGRPAIGALALGALTQALRFARVGVHPVGPDLWERYVRSEG
jgi:diaminohydroxyphosphoribosylaminopyrimidine deaminase / 5-amino-6-(5-phosphoribosylamino)uracil reductase